MKGNKTRLTNNVNCAKLSCHSRCASSSSSSDVVDTLELALCEMWLGEVGKDGDCGVESGSEDADEGS